MQDMKLIEALNDLREEVRKQCSKLRRDLLREHFRLVRWLAGAILLLGLALGGKDILQIALEAIP
jgi:hypothetical protein